jgi:hypothetical protein
MVRQGNWTFAVNLPRDAARAALTDCAGAIAKKQQRSGLWFRGKDGLSFAILRALAHAELLVPLMESSELRYDPVAPFAARQDFHGLSVRRRILHRPMLGDDRLAASLQAECIKRQRPDGCWGGVVSATSLEVEFLLELGVDAAHPALVRAAAWMLGQFCSVERRRPKAAWAIEVKDMITTDSKEEFVLARDMLPDRNLGNACFFAIPILPTALALRALVRLGRHRDARVERAYDSLLDMQIRGGENAFGRALHPGWCGHQCRFKLEARLRGQRGEPCRCRKSLRQIRRSV